MSLRFHDFTVTPDCAVLSHRVHDSAKLEPRAVEWFTTMMDQHSLWFRETVAPEMFPTIELEFRELAPGNVEVRFYSHGELVTVSTIASGQSAEMEELGITERPAMASIVTPTRWLDDLQIIADMETCLAAAYLARVL